MTHLRLKNPLLLAALAAAYPFTGHAATAARVEFAAGSVVAVTASGGQRLLVKGSELQPGEMIRTSETGRAQLKFADGALMSLQPETEFRIDEYKYDGKGGNPSDKSFFSLLKGGMRTISGLIGKANRDNYKVNTAVATIGIRGTEYSVAFTGGNDGTLNLATGEGAVEVCNAGGCVIVSGGDSAVVTGNNSKPTRTDTRPNLPPSSSTSPAAATYSTSENRDSSGDLVALGGGMVSGPGYAYVNAFWTGSSPVLDYDDGTNTVTATFANGSKLTKLESSSYVYEPGTVTSSFSLNGVIGWGTWTGGTRTPTGGYGSPDSLESFHYLVGKPTSLSDLSGLSGLTGSYSFAGGTNPTSSMGYTGSNVTGSLSIDFTGGGYYSASASVSFTMNSNNVSLSFSAGEGYGAVTSMSGTCNSGCSSGSTEAQLLLAGTNASHAGVAYKIYNDQNVGNVVGVAAFKQTSTSPTGGGGS